MAHGYKFMGAPVYFNSIINKSNSTSTLFLSLNLHAAFSKCIQSSTFMPYKSDEIVIIVILTFICFPVYDK